jgi:stringent starvation protein B
MYGPNAASSTARCVPPAASVPFGPTPRDVIGSATLPMPPADPPPKKDQLQKLLARGSVFVHLDPRREGVKVPEWLAARPQLVLQLGLNFAIPIPDLVIDERGVRCTLSFNRSPFYCVLPWGAVYAVVAEDGQVTVWPKEVPPELVPAPAPVRRGAPSTRGERNKPQRPRISVVPPIAPEADAKADAKADTKSDEGPREGRGRASAPPQGRAAASRPRARGPRPRARVSPRARAHAPRQEAQGPAVVSARRQVA